MIRDLGDSKFIFNCLGQSCTCETALNKQFNERLLKINETKNDYGCDHIYIILANHNSSLMKQGGWLEKIG